MIQNRLFLLRDLRRIRLEAALPEWSPYDIKVPRVPLSYRSRGTLMSYGDHYGSAASTEKSSVDVSFAAFDIPQSCAFHSRLLS